MSGGPCLEWGRLILAGYEGRFRPEADVKNRRRVTALQGLLPSVRKALVAGLLQYREIAEPVTKLKINQLKGR